MAISRMQQPQQMQGGLGALDAPRQGYFLGKLVKKATRAVKKVAKSPLGKAALIGGGMYLTGGMLGGGGGLGNFAQLGRSAMSGLGSLKDFAMNKGTQGFNLAKQIPGMALSAMTGIPGIGMILGALGNMGSNEYAQATTANMQKQNNNLQGLGLDGVSNFGGVTTDDLGRITNNGLNYNTPEGIMSGYNSGFDLAGKALGRIGTIQEAIEKGRFKDKFALDRANKKINNLKTAAVASAQAKRQAYQDKIDRAKNQAAQDRARTKSITAGYGGHDNSPGATGPTAVGAGMGVGGGYNTDHGFKKDGGMIGYRNGGLASMFTRRR